VHNVTSLVELTQVLSQPLARRLERSGGRALDQRVAA
jgi:hypothetical protein